MSWSQNTPVQVFGKSMHSGQTGTVVRDDGPYVMIQADDPSYIHAHKNTIRPKDSEDRFFWVSTECLKEVK